MLGAGPTQTKIQHSFDQEQGKRHPVFYGEEEEEFNWFSDQRGGV